VPTGAELCFNQLDDDCDGRIDCADPDCGPTAQCVPLDPTGGKIGIMTGVTATCPSGYTDQTTINKGLAGGTCTGCSCRPPTASCGTNVYSYATATDCATTTNAGTFETAFSTTQACTTPAWVGSTFGTLYGVAVSAFAVTLTGSCAPQGTPTLGPATWAVSNRFCATTMLGGGCQAGQACVPVNSAAKCAIFDGSHSCPAGTAADSWNTGYTDSRSCGTCTCGSPTGQSCSAVRLNVGTDYTCAPNVTATLASASRFCYAGNGVYSPGIVFTGAPTQPTCPGMSQVSGALTPTGPKTVCCLP
jgi:hypothetical protein